VYKLPVFVELDEDAINIWKRFLNISATNNNENGKKIRTAENIDLRNQMGQYIIDIAEKEIQKAGLQETCGIYRIAFDDISHLYDPEKGFTVV